MAHPRHQWHCGRACMRATPHLLTQTGRGHSPGGSVSRSCPSAPHPPAWPPRPPRRRHRPPLREGLRGRVILPLTGGGTPERRGCRLAWRYRKPSPALEGPARVDRRVGSTLWRLREDASVLRRDRVGRPSRAVVVRVPRLWRGCSGSPRLHPLVTGSGTLARRDTGRHCVARCRRDAVHARRRPPPTALRRDRPHHPFVAHAERRPESARGTRAAARSTDCDRGRVCHLIGTA